MRWLMRRGYFCLSDYYKKIKIKSRLSLIYLFINMTVMYDAPINARWQRLPAFIVHSSAHLVGPSFDLGWGDISKDWLEYWVVIQSGGVFVPAETRRSRTKDGTLDDSQRQIEDGGCDRTPSLGVLSCVGDFCARQKNCALYGWT
jgi:hypothetical protein